MIPKIQTQIAKTAPPPPGLPIYGRLNPATVSFMGQTNYASTLEEKRFIFGIKRQDRRHHIYVVGQRNIGKSKLLELLIRQDIASGYGLMLIDYQGSLTKGVLDFIPQKRMEDVVYLDPADAEHSLIFNPFSGVDFKIQFIKDLTEIMKDFFGSLWMPRIDHLFRFACLALLDYPGARFSEIMNLLTDESFRLQVVKYIKNDLVKNFWEIEFSKKWLPQFETEAIRSLIDKLSQFFSHPAIRQIFNHQENKINFEEFIENKKIILVSLSRNKLGEENAAILGSIFLMKLRLAGIARQSLNESQRQDFYVYIDGFNNLALPIFENFLAEAHLGGLNFTITHTSLTQLSTKTNVSLLSNIGTLIIFRVSGEDALRLETALMPVFKARDMINLASGEFYIKMIIDGETFDPFSSRTLKVLPPSQPSYHEQIIELSRKKYTGVV